MTPERLFHELLGLGLNWEVVESRFERESGTVHLEVRETPQLWDLVRCPKDTGRVFCYDHTEVLTWRHLNVFRVRPPWEGLSTALHQGVRSLRAPAPARVAHPQGRRAGGRDRPAAVADAVRQVAAACAQADFSNVCCIGVDEMSVRKGHEYLSVFADLVKQRVRFATEGKDHGVWVKFIEALEQHYGHRHAVPQVSMAMSPAYQQGVKETCRNAPVGFEEVPQGLAFLAGDHGQ